MRPLIVFDFDGTIADSIDCLVDVLNQVAVEEGYSERVSRELLHKRPIQDALRHLGIPFWRVPRYIKECRRGFAERLARIQAHPDLLPVLQDLALRADLAILSSNSEENVNAVLERLELQSLFTWVEEAGAFDKHKRLRRLRKEGRRVLYIGDETRDIHAAQRARVHSLAVTWGYADAEQLLRAQPDMIASTPRELLMLINAWLDA